MNIQTVGLVAGCLTTAAWVPQLVRTGRTGSADELSWPYLLVFAAGVSTWILYAILSADLPVFLANLVSILLIGALVEVKSGARPRCGPPSRRGAVHCRSRRRRRNHGVGLPQGESRVKVTSRFT